MANTVGSNPISQGTLPGSAQAIPTLQRQTATQAESQVPGFAQAFAGEALTPTALGVAASNITTQTSNRLAEKQGYDFANQNPNMKFLPTGAKSDEVFAQAYKAQSSAILGLDAQRLINNNLEELSQQTTLTPDLINSFTQSSAQGVEDILKNAPDEVRASLSVQYSQHLESQSHKLNMDMIEQSKVKAKQQAQAFRAEQTHNMIDVMREGTQQSLKVGSFTKFSIDNNIDASEASGQITALEAQSARISNNINYETALQTNKALAARENGTLESFIANMADTKIPGLTWAESESVKDNVIQTVVGYETAVRRDHSLTMAKGNNLIQTGRMTPGILESMRGDLTQEEFLKLSTSYAITHHETNKKEQAVNSIISNPQSALVYNGQTNESINTAFDRITEAHLDNEKKLGTLISNQEAEFLAASNMNHPVPKYVDGISNAILAGTVAEAKSAIEQAERLHAAAGFKTTGISDRAKATGEMFRVERGQYPGNEDEALKQAREIVSNKTDEVINLNKTRINDELSKHRGAQSLTSWAVNLGGLGGGDYDNLNAFTANAVSQFSAYMQLTNGNIEVSKKMARDSLSKLYAPSFINGERQISYLPIETLMKIPNGAAPLIQSDIIRDIKPQFAQSKASFDQGNTTSYWRLKEGRVDYEKYAEAKAIINETMSFKGIKEAFKDAQGTKLAPNQIIINKLQPYRDIVKQYEKGAPVEVELVTRGGDRVLPTLTPAGLISKGNINLDNLKSLKNEDGTTSSVSTMTAEFDGKTYLLPTVVDGKRLSQDEAVENFKSTRNHLGIFQSLQDADLYDEELHKSKGWMGKGNRWPKYFKGKSKTYNLNVTSSPSTQVSNITGQVVGRYNVGVKDAETGIVSAMSGYFGGINTNPEVNPDPEWVRERFLSVNGLTEGGSYEERWKRYSDTQFRHDEALKRLQDRGTQPMYLRGR